MSARHRARRSWYAVAENQHVWGTGLLILAAGGMGGMLAPTIQAGQWLPISILGGTIVLLIAAILLLTVSGSRVYSSRRLQLHLKWEQEDYYAINRKARHVNSK